MMTLTLRPYGGEADLEAIANLFNTCEAVDCMDSGRSVSELRQSFEHPILDTVNNIRLWEDTQGQLIGFGQLWIPPTGKVIDGSLWFRVHPAARGSDLEQQIVAWAEGRMREVSQERGVSVQLRSGCRADKFYYTSILEGWGFTPKRYFFTMERSLLEPILEPQFPEGFTVRHTIGKQDITAWVEMFNQTFIDHWNHRDLTVEVASHLLNHPHYRPELDLGAIAPDGTFASFCYCHINPDSNQRKGCNEGWIDVLGTRRDFRQLGLGRAMLLTGLQQLKAAGVETAKLGVDSENPNGAVRLYESVGFCRLYSQIMYFKDV